MLKRASKVALAIALLACTVQALPQAWADTKACMTMPAVHAPSGNRVADWFQQYDQIRRQAQMSPTEKERSSQLLTQGIAANFIQSANAAQDKAAATSLLRKMVDRYHRAVDQITQLPQIPETKKLQVGYRVYFENAGGLFADYLKMQDNLFATDSNGNSIMGQLSQRKADLETLDAANKDLDARLRAKYRLAPYAY